MQSRTYTGRLAPALAMALMALATAPAHAALSESTLGSSSAAISLDNAVLSSAEDSSNLLADASSTTSSGNAYLLFAQALTQPAFDRQANVGTQIAGYVSAFGPINRTAEDGGGGPTPVPVPATVWLLVSGVALLRKTTGLGNSRKVAHS